MDPFSAASGVAGLISLGIEVCKGLNIYCQDFRSRDVDILLLDQHAQRLEAFLHLLNNRVTGGGKIDSTLSSTLDECYSACNVCLADFKALSSKYSRPTAVRGVKEQGKEVLRHLQFPFQKHRFDDLRTQMREFHAALSSCLLLLNRDLSSEVLETTISESAKLSSAILLQGQKTTAQLAVLLPQIDKTIESRLKLFENAIQTRLESVERALQGSSKPACHLEEGATISTLSCDQFTQSSKLPTVHGLELTRLRGNKEKAEKQSELTKTSQSSMFGCSCDSMPPRRQTSCAGSEATTHKKSCRFSFVNPTIRIISGNIRILNTLFRWKIGIRYSRAVFMRDLQVQPNFTARAVVRSNNEAFMQIWRLGRVNQANKDDIESEMRYVLQNLHQLFRDRRAWPTDVSQSYEYNLLHWACFTISHSWSKETIPLFVEFCKSLISMGVPLNDTGASGSPLQVFLIDAAEQWTRQPESMRLRSRETTEYVAKAFVEMGVFCPENPSGEAWRMKSNLASIVPGVYTWLADSLHCFDYGEIQSALFRKSEADIRRLLAASPDLIFESGAYRQTALHIATFWPRGLELLFELAEEACQSMIEVPDPGGRTPIQYAVTFQEAKSIALLLKKGARVILEETGTSFMFPNGSRTLLQSLEVCTVLSNELAIRNTAMLQYAVQHLPDTEIERLGLLNKSMIQENSYEVVQSLKAHGIRVPQKYEQTRLGSVYHSFYLNATIAEALFRSGFEGVDSALHGYTPLMLFGWRRWTSPRDQLDGATKLLEWFYRKKADFQAPIPHKSYAYSSSPTSLRSLEYRAIHRVVFVLGEMMAASEIPEWTQEDSATDGSRCVLLARKALSSCPQDLCQCYCSIDGCSPGSLYMKGLSKALRNSGVFSYSDCSCHKTGERWLHFTRTLSVISGASCDILREFVRACTFDRLGMRHTCCKHGNGYHVEDDRSVSDMDILQGKHEILRTLDPIEIAEIRDEERYLAETLERLMEEFEFKLQDSREPVEKFWGFWMERMAVFDQEKDVLSEEELQAFANIGVHLKEV